MPLPVTSGLVLHLETDSGVTTSGGVVTGWSDLSGLGNNLTATGDPVLGTKLTPSGAQAISLDGDGDALERVLGLTGLPSGNEDRTVFFVADYIDMNDITAGAVFGDGASNQAFGVAADKTNEFTVQGWGRGNDFDSNVNGVTPGFAVQSVVLEGSTISHYLNGALIDSDTHSFSTDLQKLVIGKEIANLGYAEMDVGAVIVFDRALTDEERQQVEAYLQEKYIADGVNDAPLALDDTAVVSDGGQATIDVLANDTDDTGLDPASVTIVSGPSHGVIGGIDPATGQVSYTHDGSGQPDSFTYTVADSDGLVSAETTVDISVGTPAFSLDGFSDELVLDRSGGIGQPISMAFLPDNRMLLIEKTGEIRIVDPESGANSIYMDIGNIDAGQERGLLDITLDPNFEENGYFYLYYTPASPQNARIARFTHQENSGGLTSTGSLSSEFVVWEDSDGYLSCCHYGGGLDFGIDGKIWLTTSDKFQTTTPGEGPSGGTDLPVLLDSPSGKVIRVNSDGTIPDGSDGWAANPFVDGPGGNEDAIWAYGLRNPFRARWDDEYGNFYIGEVGGNQQNLAHEDLHVANLDGAGSFFGWPYYEGTPNTLVNNSSDRFDLPQPDGDLGDADAGDLYSAPIFSYAHAGSGASLTGGEVYRGDMFPAEWDGVYFYGDYTRDFMRYLVLDETGTQVLADNAFKPTAELPGTTNEIVNITVGEDGALYYILIGPGEIRRVTYEGNLAPSIASASATPTSGDLPLDVAFQASVSDPEGDPLTYVWSFGDGNSASGSVAADGTISVSHTYSEEALYKATLSVSDGGKTTLSQVLEITAGDPNDAPVIETVSADQTSGDAGLIVTFTAQATDPDNDQLTYIWHFGDGATEEGTLGADGSVTATHSYAADGTYDAFLEVSDGSATTVSDEIAIQIGAASEVPVTDGLVLLLQSDIKIGLGAGNTVVSWLDGSGNGNNLFAKGDPTLEESQTPTGQPAIVFDGTGDLLERVNATDQIFGLPAGSADRTMFVVVDYIAPEGVYSGVAYGDGAANEAFGLGINGSKNQLTVQGWGRGNDFAAPVEGVSPGWGVHSAVLESSVIDHYFDGGLIDSDPHAFSTDVQRLVLGAEIANLGESQLKIAAVLIYDRALSEPERQQVEAFLQDKYISGGTVDAPAVAEDDSYGLAAGSNLTVDAASGVLANDSDPDGDAFAATLVSDVANGTLSLGADGSFTYAPDDGFSGTDSFIYEVDGGDTATVSLDVGAPPPSGGVPVTAGLVVSLEADQNVTLSGGSTVAGWLDGSGRGNDLTAAGNPQLLTGATPTGQSAIAFDGTGDLLERVNSTDTLSGLPAGAADRTMFFVVDYIDPEGVAAGVAYGDGGANEAFGLVTNGWGKKFTVQGWGSGNDFASGVNSVTPGWGVQSVVLDDNVIDHYLNGSLIDSDPHVFATDLQRLVIGDEIAGIGESELQVSAVLIYDRALSDSERLAVEDYLQDKYIDDPFV